MMKFGVFALVICVGCIIQTPALEQVDPITGQIWPFHPILPPKLVECIRDLKVESACNRAIIFSFYTHKLHLPPLCCQAVAKMSDDCILPIFDRFKNPNFAFLLKSRCSKKAAGASPPAAAEPQPPVEASPPKAAEPQPPVEASPPKAAEPQPPVEASPPMAEEPQPQVEASPPMAEEPQPPVEASPPMAEDPQAPVEAPAPVPSDKSFNHVVFH